LELLGHSFDRLWPVDETPCFAALLRAIDEADRELWRERDEDKTQSNFNCLGVSPKEA
jgi:hypothetical protein